MFVITAQGIKNYLKDKKYFLAIDHNSGGYPYWSTHFIDALNYPSIEEAKNYWGKMKELFYNSINNIDKSSIKIQKIIFKNIKEGKLEV